MTVSEALHYCSSWAFCLEEGDKNRSTIHKGAGDTSQLFASFTADKQKEGGKKCFKIQTHYRKSCSEKRPQRKSFKAKRRKLISRSKNPRRARERSTARCRRPGRCRAPARCSASALLPEGLAAAPGLSHTHSCCTNGTKIIAEKEKYLFDLKLSNSLRFKKWIFFPNTLNAKIT